MPEQDGLSLAKKIWEKGNQWQGLDIPVCSSGNFTAVSLRRAFSKVQICRSVCLIIVGYFHT